MKLEILHEARDELTEAIRYYEEIEPGLGIRLKEEARRVLSWIQENPLLPSTRPKGYRRVNFKGFEYYAAYFIWNDSIWILALAHARKRPEFWLNRRKHIG